ncbi:hypothetical protein LOM8899_04182 [Flavimaricola marinus]|uniref:Oxidoreductase molybdopterin binding domain protein n=2 Tax=Flavimaricola marinus TaxID=1819565 RepID=A0A238LK52_9RHOB|nr:hypothetical protein LOM8899_04182 [Flavimaricola marinus]
MIRIFAAVFALFGQIACADGLPAPEGPVILTVTGDITRTNGDGIAEFDREMLDNLAQRATTATTPWLEGPHTFSGPMGTAILDAVGAQGETIQVVALNDYSADVPVQDLRDFDVIFATAIDGEILTVRDKGPLFLIYPFDENPDLFNEVYFGRSVWQITQINVQN